MKFNLFSRIAGNTAYILGTFAESDVGCYRILGLVTRKQSRCPNILEALVEMLDLDDTETVMNAAGTMGTLVRKIFHLSVVTNRIFLLSLLHRSRATKIL